MIYLTGDVHFSNLNNHEQKIIGSEIDSAEKYLNILKKYKLACTLFVNGISLQKEPDKIKELLKYNVELGGHTYDNFGKMNLLKSYFYRKKWGSIYGSNHYQKKDITKTKKAFEEFGLKMTSWRTHAFGSNDLTFNLLKELDVKYVSDLVGDIKPFYKEVMHMPINIPIDQNTIAYGMLKPENRNPFASCTKCRIKAEEWFDILKKRVIENEKNKIPSIILIHPATMMVLDNFKLFEEICKFLSKYKSFKISEFKL
ncbi:MAG: polysaccharide deacetylase family protein [Nanoarchaeota archaeon]|nr:polysaccharide deacetylase family protein [Nanoarchaeota archaeon]MBU1445319.1 polysaccharide deacetylase family protein [Nanoarchaeota archaeon]MBU2475293.1 polysaccharide deacetylase family protein [Nanoarchaeota archaeon]